jgi:hypothetical protein
MERPWIQIVDYRHPVHRPGKRRFFHGLHPEKRPCSRPSASSSSSEKCWRDGISSLEEVQGHRHIRIPGSQRTGTPLWIVIEVRTGFQVSYGRWFGRKPSDLPSRPALLGRGSFRRLTRVNSIIMEVGAGTTEIMLMRRGQMAAVHSLSFGAVRLGRAVSGEPHHPGDTH